MTGPIRFATLAAVLAGFVALSAQAGEVYRWKDAKGVTHYSDAPPPKGQYKAQAVRTAEPPATAIAAAGKAEAKAQAKPTPKPDAAADPTQAAADDAALAKANCTAARTNLDRLKSGGQVGMDSDGDGKPDTILNAEDLAKQTATTESQVSTFCGPAAATP